MRNESFDLKRAVLHNKSEGANEVFERSWDLDVILLSGPRKPTLNILHDLRRMRSAVVLPCVINAKASLSLRIYI